MRKSESQVVWKCCSRLSCTHSAGNQQIYHLQGKGQGQIITLHINNALNGLTAFHFILIIDDNLSTWFGHVNISNTAMPNDIREELLVVNFTLVVIDYGYCVFSTAVSSLELYGLIDNCTIITWSN